MNISVIEKLESLKLSEKDMDTSMALEFIKKNNGSDEWPDFNQMFIVKNTNEITKCKSDELNDYLKYESLIADPIQTGRKLAKKIEENAEIFVQLEYLARGTDSRDVRDGHIKLMSQLLRCGDALWNNITDWQLYVTERVPLYYLASVVTWLYCDSLPNGILPKAIIVADKKMKHLCQFFVQLCRDVGFEIPLVYANQEDSGSVNNCKEHFGDNMGCTGVVAEMSDLDSAIDAFIYSSVTAPWRLKFIYVQESIFVDFQTALTAKVRVLTGTSWQLVVKDKTFLMEPLLTEAGIRVHAYRTTKELLSLLQTPYLSLWAADSALSNEVALNAPAHTVWVNDYGSFDGPPRAALSVYNLYCTQLARVHKNNLEQILKPWVKMQAAERLEIIIAVVETSEVKDVKALLPDLTLKWRSDDFAHVTDRTVCFGIQQRMGLVGIKYIKSFDQLLPTIKVLVNGNGVISLFSKTFQQFVDELYKNGVPIAGSEAEGVGNIDVGENVEHRFPLIMERLKVIRSNYGTIFAN